MLALASASVQAQSRITREQAETAALSVARGGSIVTGALERDWDTNQVVWGFDVSIPGSRNLHSIEVDPQTGAVVSNTLEGPEDR
jgi:uncharacterized membrane protein YkoI